MKLKLITASVIGAMLSLYNVAYAAQSYYPPERINCQLNNNGRIECNEFNREYLTEDTTNADLERNRDDVFHFVTAAAYFDDERKDAVVFFTYHDFHSKVVKLRTVNGKIRPDLKNGSWKKLNEDIYTCDEGYMNCPITDQP